MKNLSETYIELGIAFAFPIEIRNERGNLTYSENSDGNGYRYEYDECGNQTYYETSDDFWYRCEYDEQGNETYYEDGDGCKFGTKLNNN